MVLESVKLRFKSQHRTCRPKDRNEYSGKESDGQVNVEDQLAHRDILRPNRRFRTAASKVLAASRLEHLHMWCCQQRLEENDFLLRIHSRPQSKPMEASGLVPGEAVDSKLST